MRRGDIGNHPRVRKRVLDGGVLRVKLAGEVRFGDHGVMVGKVVALEAERADPDLGSEVDAAEGVEKGDASLATKRRVGERGDVRM